MALITGKIFSVWECRRRKSLIPRIDTLGSAFESTGGMTPHELKQRTKRFAVVIVKFAMTLPRDPVTAVMTRQLVKSGTSLAANYRSSCRAKSKADFISKMGIAEDEADETCFWLEVLVEAEIVSQTAVVRYLDEADQLTRIFVTSINTARGSRRRN